MRRIRPALVLLHRWVSLAVGVVFAVAAGTGALLSFQHEIDGWLHRDARPAVTAGDVGFERVAQAVRRDHPGERLDLLWFPRWNNPTYEALLSEPGGATRTVMYDPGTGRSMDSPPPRSRFMEIVNELHVSLLGGTVGTWIVSISTGLVVPILLTGVLLWWPGLWKMARGFRVRTRRTAYILNFDLHQVGGIVAFPLLLAMTLSGLVLAFPDAGSRAVHALFLRRPAIQEWTEVRSGPRPAGWTEARRPDPAELIRRAHAEVPGARTFYVTWPAEADEPVHVRLQTGIDPRPWGIVSRLSFDQYTGALIQVVDPRRMSAPEAAVHYWNDRLHFGDFNPATKLAWMLAALAGVGLTVTGYVLWWMKRRNSRRAETRERVRPAEAAGPSARGTPPRVHKGKRRAGTPPAGARR
jgi:uncharacterized iron-regulated membrane protein